MTETPDRDSRLGRVEDRARSQVARLRARVAARPALDRWWGVADGVVVQQGRYRLSLAAAGVAFWLVIAAFPMVIAVVMVFGLVVDPTDLAADVQRLGQRDPNSLLALMAQQAQVVATADRGRLSVGLVVSLVVVLWSVSSGAYALFRAIREAFGQPPQAYVLARARAFAAALVIVLLLGLLLVSSALLGNWLADLEAASEVLAALVSGTVLAAVLLALLLGVVRYSIAAPTPVRDLLPGLAIAAVVISAMLVGVTLFTVFIRDYQAIYGVVAGSVLSMVVSYLAMYVLLLGVLLDAELIARRGRG